MAQNFHIEMDDESINRYSGSKHVGMPNERRDFIGLRVFMRAEKEGEYGIVTVLGFEDSNGNVLIWFATGNRSYQKGDVVNLNATIKGYDESDGVRKTVITRARETKEKKVWKACATGTSRRAHGG